MRIREFRESDISRVKEIFNQQAFEYGEPDWSQMFGGVLEDDHGAAQIFLLNRPTVESYAVVGQGDWARPGMKATQFARLDEYVMKQLQARGYTDQHSWVPPVCRAFLRRLKRFCGWVESAGPEKWTGLVRHI